MEPNQGPNQSNLTGNDPLSNLIRQFQDKDLPPQDQEYSRLVGDLARVISGRLPVCPDLLAGLQKLIEAKDLFIAASHPQPAKQE